MANNGKTIRQSVENLDAAALAALRDAYSKMQALKGDDNRSWIHWAGQHGYPNWHCWHHSRVGMGQSRPYNLFLPWHRAYLLYWEHTMRDQNDAAALPWWNWTSVNSHKVGVPQAFAKPEVKKGQPNSLNSGPVPAFNGSPTRRSVRFTGAPRELPTKAEIDSLLASNSYVDFQSQLEDIHDAVHGWCGGINPNNPQEGGDMGTVALAAFDPIFWSHHCMIDRLWFLWQRKHGINNIPPDLLNLTLAPFALTVADVLDIGHLGYSYADTVAVSVHA